MSYIYEHLVVRFYLLMKSTGQGKDLGKAMHCGEIISR